MLFKNLNVKVFNFFRLNQYLSYEDDLKNKKISYLNSILYSEYRKNDRHNCFIRRMFNKIVAKE